MTEILLLVIKYLKIADGAKYFEWVKIDHNCMLFGLFWIIKTILAQAEMSWGKVRCLFILKQPS